MTQIEQLSAWLNSAHAMELSMANVLEIHAKEARAWPEMSARIAEHAEETRGHVQRVEECLASLGKTPSTMKSAMGSVMGRVQGAATGMFHDAIIKNVLGDYSAEYFEIACYTSLACAAVEAGQPQIADICREILLDEESMALWLEAQIEPATRSVLDQKLA
jgi:ferritin-like metal-binding protein YciE